MKRLDDNAVSELMGYTVLVAVVSLAAIGLLTGGMGTLSAAEKQMEFTGSLASLDSFADTVSAAVETNNTFFTAHEMSVPQGYDLMVRDAHDDFRAIGIYEDDKQLAFAQLGSIRLRSPFRTVTFESGAVISNDTGLVAGALRPSIHTIDIGKGKQALYVSIVSISADPLVTHSGPVTLYVRCSSVTPMEWHLHTGSTLILRISSGDDEAWKGELEKCGFSVGYEDGALKATNGEVSDIYVTIADVEVKKDGR